MPASTGTGAFAAERYSEARGRPWDSQPHPSRYTASRQRFLRAASEVRYHRVSRAASNHTQTLITFAYHRVRRILLPLRTYLLGAAAVLATDLGGVHPIILIGIARCSVP